MALALMALGSYLLGSFPTGVVLSRKKYGLDVRDMGSGNIGATNITRTFGWYAGALTFLADCLKGALPTWVAAHYFESLHPWMVPVAGVSVVAGHCFSLFLKGRGGKGVATSLGALAVVAPLGAGLAALTYVLFLGASRISAVGSLAGIAAANLYLLFFSPAASVVRLTVGVSVLVVIRHHSNIRRLLAGFRKGES